MSVLEVPVIGKYENAPITIKILHLLVFSKMFSFSSKYLCNFSP